MQDEKEKFDTSIYEAFLSIAKDKYHDVYSIKMKSRKV